MTKEMKKAQNQNNTAVTSSTYVKIMPLGDSITLGTGDDPRGVGYREDLFNLLNAGGYNFKFVGNEINGYDNYNPPPNTDFYNFGRHHEGHGGWIADGSTPYNSIEDNIISWLTTLKNHVPSDEPDIILLHIATNDCYSDNPATIKDDILRILDDINGSTGFNSNIMTIFATLIFYSHNDVTLHNHPPDYENVIDNLFEISEQDNLNNTLLPTEATNLISVGRNVSLVDMNSVLSQSEYPTYFSQHRTVDPSPPDFNDVHPNTIGYTEMANAWFNKLTTILPILQLKVFLQGPYAGGGSMTTTINGIIPATSPYQDVNNNSQYLNGTDHVVVPYSIPTNITDWVQIEIRNNNTTTVVGSKSCFLRDDGQVIAPDGLTENISLGIIPDDYYIVIKHRNHLAVMSSDVVQINGLTTYDFTTGQDKAYYTTDPAPMADLGGSKFGMWMGDVNSDGVVKYNLDNNDRVLIYNRIGNAGFNITVSGYYNEDVNLDGVVKYNLDNNDGLLIYNVIGNSGFNLTKSTQVP